jgi:hypothetical protein
MVRVILTPTDEDPEEMLHAFEQAHGEAIEDLRKKVAQKMPFIGRVQFTVPEQPGQRKHPVISMSISPPDRTAPGRNLSCRKIRTAGPLPGTGRLLPYPAVEACRTQHDGRRRSKDGMGDSPGR